MNNIFLMTIRRRNSLVLFVLITSLVMSCKNIGMSKNSIENKDVTKEERLDLFLESPINVNANANEQRLNAIKFHKSYILNDNPHFNADSDSVIKASSDSYVLIGGSNFDKEQDSLIRISSDTDVIEILKNKYVERITYMRLNSDGIKLNYGMYIGMALDSFTQLLPIKIDQNYIASYRDNESFEMKFTFDKDSKRLKEFNYISIID